MPKSQLETAVVLIIFNRPETTERVFKKIRLAQPSKLFVIADGPRENVSGEYEKCLSTRAVIDNIDWECKLLKNYSEVNLGCKKRVSGGLDWVFNNVDEAIILEDDCVPHLSFFQFCEELLEKYRNNERIMIISGTNIMGSWKKDLQNYHFSYSGGIWGWATWKRAWKYYDGDMKQWENEEVRKGIKDVIIYPRWYNSITKSFENSYLKEGDNWGYPWAFARFIQSGMAIVPSVNLISNIGWGSDATHTSGGNSKLNNLPVYKMDFPLSHRSNVMVDRKFDRKYIDKLLQPFIIRKFGRFKRLFTKK